MINNTNASDRIESYWMTGINNSIKKKLERWSIMNGQREIFSVHSIPIGNLRFQVCGLPIETDSDDEDKDKKEITYDFIFTKITENGISTPDIKIDNTIFKLDENIDTSEIFRNLKTQVFQECKVKEFVESYIEKHGDIIIDINQNENDQDDILIKKLEAIAEADDAQIIFDLVKPFHNICKIHNEQSQSVSSLLQPWSNLYLLNRVEALSRFPQHLSLKKLTTLIKNENHWDGDNPSQTEKQLFHENLFCMVLSRLHHKKNLQNEYLKRYITENELDKFDINAESSKRILDILNDDDRLNSEWFQNKELLEIIPFMLTSTSLHLVTERPESNLIMEAKRQLQDAPNKLDNDLSPTARLVNLLKKLNCDTSPVLGKRKAIEVVAESIDQGANGDDANTNDSSKICIEPGCSEAVFRKRKCRKHSDMVPCKVRKCQKAVKRGQEKQICRMHLEKEANGEKLIFKIRKNFKKSLSSLKEEDEVSS